MSVIIQVCSLTHSTESVQSQLSLKHVLLSGGRNQADETATIRARNPRFFDAPFWSENGVSSSHERHKIGDSVDLEPHFVVQAFVEFSEMSEWLGQRYPHLDTIFRDRALLFRKLGNR